MSFDVMEELVRDARRILAPGPSADQRARQRAVLIEEAAHTARSNHRVPAVILVPAAVAATVALVIGLLMIADRGERALTCWIDGRGELSGGEWIKAPAGEASILRFSEQSRIEVQPLARMRLAELADEAVGIVIESGRIQSSVRSAAGRRWEFTAGPYEVLVVGTEFSIDWNADQERLIVEVLHGTVDVRGGTLVDRGVLVRDEQRLVVSATGVDLQGLPGGDRQGEDGGDPPSAMDAPDGVDALDAGLSDPSPVPAVDGSQRPARKQPEQAGNGWKELAEANRFADAVKAAGELGFEHLFSSLAGDDLLLLADAARLSGRSRLAVSALAAVRERFPGSRESGLAAFRLGRLAFDAGRFNRAAGWFESYVRESPRGSMIADARGRLLESLDKAGRREAAQQAAEMYIQHYPGGRYAGLARKVLGESADQ